MPASEARIAANRANARKSTGPRTEQGKARSRANGLKHGLTGQGVVLPEGDLEQVEALAQELAAELNPSGPIGRILVRRMAVLSARMDRAVEQERAALAGRVRHAQADFDDAQAAEVERLWDWITAEPAANARRLRATPEGVDRMVRAWSDLRDDLVRQRWGFTHADKAENLTGRRLGDLPASRLLALSKAAWGDSSMLEEGDGAGLDEPARRRWAEARLAERVDAEVAALREHRATLDPGAFATDRAEAGARALFDPSREATLARKYEAAAERGFYRALREFREVEAEAAAGRPEEAVEAGPDDEALGSSLPAVTDRPDPAPPRRRGAPRRPSGPPHRAGTALRSGFGTTPGPA